MKNLFSKTLFISLLLSATIPSGIQAGVGLGGIIPEMGRGIIVKAAITTSVNVVAAAAVLVAAKVMGAREAGMVVGRSIMRVINAAREMASQR